MNTPLQRYVQTLWQHAPALHGTREAVSYIAGRAIYLPADRVNAAGPSVWRWLRASTAHAAAHLAFSPAVFDGRGVPPITRALIGLLEDARVEALACRELPGLRRLWAALHTVQPGDSGSFETLMLRLARSLIDIDFDDPHPWVRKGKSLFFVDAAVPVLALRCTAELRKAASLLGNDIGQMRLQFNARSYAVGPDYRDDSRWMWPVGQSPQDEPSQLQPSGRTGPVDGELLAPEITRSCAHPDAHRYPEWDRLIARLRHDWCTVFEAPVAAAQGVRDARTALPLLTAQDGGLQRELRRQLEWRRSGLHRRQPSHEGDMPDIDSLVRVRVAQRRGGAADGPLYRRAAPPRNGGRWMLLIDQSASTSGPWGDSGTDLLQASCRIAVLLARALQTSAPQLAVCGFSSNGRHQVAVRCAKDFTENLDSHVLAQLASLQSADSTRLGAALRHATRRICAGGSDRDLHLMVISDGLPYDIDVHDRHYLVQDARHAVQSAGRRGVRVHCIVLDPAGLAVAHQMFGPRGAAVLHSLQQLPALMARLGGCGRA